MRKNSARAICSKRPAVRTDEAEDDGRSRRSIISPAFAASEDHRHKRGGLLSMFGGGRPRHEPAPAPLRDFRNDPTPVLQARAAATGAQAAAQPVEDEQADAGEDLEIPSFLRRLAN